MAYTTLKCRSISIINLIKIRTRALRESYHRQGNITRKSFNSVQCMLGLDMVKYNENHGDLYQSQNLLESKLDKDPFLRKLQPIVVFKIQLTNNEKDK